MLMLLTTMERHRRRGRCFTRAARSERVGVFAMQQQSSVLQDDTDVLKARVRVVVQMSTSTINGCDERAERMHVY
jgi:hypothetical protein